MKNTLKSKLETLDTDYSICVFSDGEETIVINEKNFETRALLNVCSTLLLLVPEEHRWWFVDYALENISVLKKEQGETH